MYVRACVLFYMLVRAMVAIDCKRAKKNRKAVGRLLVSCWLAGQGREGKGKADSPAFICLQTGGSTFWPLIL